MISRSILIISNKKHEFALENVELKFDSNSMRELRKIEENF